MGPWFGSLRARLMLLLAIALAPSVGLMVLDAIGQREMAGQGAQQAALRVGRAIAAEHLGWVERTRGLLEVLSHVPVVQAADSPACDALLADVKEVATAYQGVGVVDYRGRHLCYTGGPLPADPTNTRWFRNALRTRQFAMGTYELDPATGRATVTFAQPVLNSAGQVERLVLASLDFGWLATLASEAYLPAGSTVMVLDPEGNVLARYPDDPKWSGRDTSDHPLVTAVLGLEGNEESTLDMPGIDGVDRLYGVVPFAVNRNGAALKAVVGIPHAQAFAGADSALQRNLIALGGIALMALFAAWFAGERFVLSRVGLLVTAAEGIAEGSLQTRTGLPHDKTEVGRVARAFDQMAAALQEREAERLVAEQQRIALAREQAAREAAEAHQARSAMEYAVSSTLLNAASIEAAAPDLTEVVGQTIGAHAGVLWEAAPPGNGCQWKHTWKAFGASEPEDEALWDTATLAASLPKPGDDGLAARALEIEADGPWAQAWNAGFKWRIQVPLVSAVGCRGAMEFLCVQLPPEPVAMLASLTTVGLHIGQFMDKHDAQAAREEEEKRLRALVETSPAAVVVAEAGSERILHANQEWERITGRSRDEVQRVEDLVPIAVRKRPDGREYLPEEEPMLRALRKGETVLAEEITYQFPDGRQIPALVSAAPVKDENGHVTAAILVKQDISKLHEVERLRSEFLGMVGHELRTPLAIIRMTAEASILESPGDRPEVDAFQTIIQQADRLLRLVANLRDVAQVEAGAFSVRRQPAALAPLIEEAARSIEQTTACRVKTQIPDNIPTLEVDSERILQVLHNLLHNATKFSPPDEPVRLSVEVGETEVTVHVTNIGPGIPEEQQAYLFRKFSQLHREGGTGLGLAISKGIVEAHGGRIWVTSSAKATETTFSFALPVPQAFHEQAPPSTPPQETKQARIKHPPAEDADTRRVLVVDDEPLILKHVIRVLRKAGLDAIGADSAEPALEAAEEGSLDLIVLDQRLPGLDGFELFGELRKRTQAPVIFLSAGAHQEDQQQALALGAADYLVKPVSPQELVGRIKAVLQGEGGRRGRGSGG